MDFLRRHQVWGRDFLQDLILAFEKTDYDYDYDNDNEHLVMAWQKHGHRMC